MSFQQEASPFRRTPLYFHSQDYMEVKEMVGQERWNFLTADLLKVYFLDPSLETMRLIFGNMLWELYNKPQEARDAGYDELDILISIMVIQQLATDSGIILGQEVERIRDQGEPLPFIDTASKYSTWHGLILQAKEWSAKGEVAGLGHGAMDPPHVGHGRLAARIWPYCDHLVIGFDPNWYVKERKGEDRPRFPQLAWRMWEMASLPTVDKVVVLPLRRGQDEEEEFAEIYGGLGVKVLGTSKDNKYYPKYVERMKQMGGLVVTEGPLRWSSSKLVGDLSDEEIASRALLDADSIRKHAESVHQKAVSLGYLKDYIEDA